MISIIATSDSLDAFLAEALRQAAENTVLAQNSARRHLGRMSEANLNQISALDNLGRAVASAGFELHGAGFQLSRSIMDAAFQINQAVILWSAALIWSWVPALGAAVRREAVAAHPETGSGDDETEDAGDFVMSGLQFQPPLGVISSGLVESPDED